MSGIAILVCTAALALAAVASVARVLRPGTVADRTLGLDMAVIVLASSLVVGAARDQGTTSFLPVVSVVALLAFVATVTIARFLEPDSAADQDGPTDDRSPS